MNQPQWEIHPSHFRFYPWRVDMCLLSDPCRPPFSFNVHRFKMQTSRDRPRMWSLFFFFFVGYLEQGERTLGPLMPPKSQVRQRNPIEISLRMVRLSFLKAAQLMIVTCHPHGSCLTTDAGWLAAHRLAAKSKVGLEIVWFVTLWTILYHIILMPTIALSSMSTIYHFPGAPRSIPCLIIP